MNTDKPADDFVPLADVSGLDIADLAAKAKDPALAASIDRLVASLDDPDGVISAFSSFVS